MCSKGREGLLGREKKSWIDFLKSCGNYFICRFYAKAAKKMEKRRGGRKIEQTSVCEDTSGILASLGASALLNISGTSCLSWTGFRLHTSGHDRTTSRPSPPRPCDMACRSRTGAALPRVHTAAFYSRAAADCSYRHSTRRGVARRGEG